VVRRANHSLVAPPPPWSLHRSKTVWIGEGAADVVYCKERSQGKSFWREVGCYTAFRLKLNYLFDHIYVCWCTTMIINIFSYLLLKIVYFKNIY
jgi:hypothetical protein